jgi:hypothetical protein
MTDKRCVFLQVPSWEWEAQEVERLADTVDSALPEDVSPVVILGEIDFLTSEEVEELGETIIEATQ